MAYPHHLEAFVQLGTLFNEFCESDTIENDRWKQQLQEVVVTAEIHNKWYTKENVKHALRHWGSLLTAENLSRWQSTYLETNESSDKKVAIVMAGNIPLVGFHDFLSVLLSGKRVIAKLSSNDKVILSFIRDFLSQHDKELGNKIQFTEERLSDFDAVIATGSNNTSRYFEYYFGKYPSIIRKNRNSIAILTGAESKSELEGLGEDIFRYFGLGCRSVSKLFVPMNFDFDIFFKAIFDWKHLLDHHKYVNNYDYNKAVYLMSEVNILDNGFLILKEDTGFASPIATLFFEYYEKEGELRARLQERAADIQCIVSNGFIDGEIPFGATQTPALNDYADGIDTMNFLAGL